VVAVLLREVEAERLRVVADDERLDVGEGADGRERVEVEVDGETLVVEWVPEVRSALDSSAIAEGREVGSARVTSAATGEEVAFDQPFWFAVAAFRPDVRVIGS